MWRGKLSRIGALLAALTLLIQMSAAQGQQKPKEIVWTHAFDLACRRLGEVDFTKDTQRFGVEAFQDTNNGLGLYVSQVGALAAARAFQVKPTLDSKGPEWLTGLDLPARAAGDDKFDNAKVYSMEVFRDPNTNDWIYVTDKGYLAVAPVKAKPAPGADRKPKWIHSVDLHVRKGGVKDWSDAAKFGIEVYRDNATGNLIYVSETGASAVLPEIGNAKPAAEGKAPVWLHGLDLACRKHNERSFTKDTRRFGVEVFLDANNGNLIFIGDTGNIAVTPGPKDPPAPTPNVKEPVWTHGLNLKVRKAGEKDFSPATAVYGAEAFREENLGVILYVCETGAIAAVAN